MSESIAPIKTWFNGLQPRWLSGNRLFRIYVSDRMLAGAYIAGQIHDQQSGNIQLQQAAFFLRAWVRRRVEQRHEREDSYDARDPFGPSFLGHDTRNFQILRSDISGSCFKRNRSLWTPYNVGSVELSFLDGSTRRFIIVGDQDPGAVLDLLTRFDPTIEVTGKSNPLPKPSPSRTRLSYMMLGVSLLLTGMLFGATAVAGVAPLAAHAPLAGINLLAGAWCLVRALRIPNDSSKDGQD